MMLRLLGTIEAGASSDSVQVVTAPRIRLILALLGAHAGQRVSTDRLIDALWPDGAPKSADASLQVHISKIRRIFEPDLAPRAESRFVVHQPGAYLLALDRDLLDVTALLDAEQHNDTDTSEALALWNDPPFAEYADEPWAIGAATELRRAHLSLAQRHYERAITDGYSERVIDDLRADVAAHPYDERLSMWLMRALYHLNDQRGALDAANDLRSRLRDDLGLDPTPDVRRLEHQILTHDDELRVRIDAPTRRTGAVERTPMYGRDDDLQRLRAAIGTHRLVTLTGPGGVGKTRLAHALADGVDRSDFVDLSSVRDTEDAVAHIETHLGIDGDPLTDRVDSIASTIAATTSLLVLDNCEQLPDDFAAAVTRVAAAAGECRLLITSQRSLGIVGEHLLRIAAFELPTTPMSNAELAAHPGIRVLCDAADLQVAPHNADDLIRLHDRLDGLPLALQLASIRLRSMGADDVMALSGTPTIDGPVDLPERHRSLDALLSTSIDALSAFQQELLDACSIFVGAVPIDAIVRLMADKADPVDVRIGTAELVDRNLLTMSSDGAVRYRMLETVRHHCHERLAASGRTDELHRRHRKVVRGVATDSVMNRDSVIEIDDIHDEATAALERLERTPGDAARDVAFVEMVATAWYGVGRVPEACTRLRNVLDLHADADAMSIGSATALLGMISFDTGSFHDLATYTADAVRLLEPTGTPMLDFLRAGHHVGSGELDPASEAISAFLQGPAAIGRVRLAALEVACTIAWYRGDYDTAADHFTAQHDVASAHDDAYFTAHSLRGQAMMAALSGSPEAGLELCRRADDITQPRWASRTLGDRHAAATLIRFEMGDVATARSEARAVLDLSVQRFNAQAVAITTPIAVACALADGDAPTAARLSGWFNGLCGATGLYAPPASRVLLDDTVEAARQIVPSPQWTTLRADGAALGLGNALSHW